MSFGKSLKSWSALTPQEQLALRQDYQAEIDKQPLTCSIDEKVARFTAWLAERGVAFSTEDLRGPRKD